MTNLREDTQCIQDNKVSIARTANRFFSGTLLSRISGVGRDVAMAAAFGTQETLGAFLVAFRLAHLLRRIFGEGALQSAFIPQFEHLRHQGSLTRALLFFRDLNAFLLIFLAILITTIMLAIQGALSWMSLSEKSRQLFYLTLLMMPSLLFICLYGVNASLLQCQRKFFISSVAPVAFNVAWICGILLVKNTSPDLAMPILAQWVIIASIAQWAVTLPFTLAILREKGSTITGLFSSISLFSQDLRSLLKPLSLGILGVAAAQVNSALDALFARYAEPGGPAFLWYAIRIQQLPLALFGIAISSALLPPLSRAIKAQDLPQSRQLLTFTLSRSLSLMIPITLWIFLASDVCVNLLYGRGDFNQASLEGTTHCLWAYGAGLIPMTLILVISPLFYAQNQYRIPAWASLMSMTLNAGLNALFILVFDWGASSVAWATSLSALANLSFLAYALSRQEKSFMEENLTASLCKIAIASLAGFAGLYWLEFILNGHVNLWNLSSINYPREFSLQCLQVLQRAFSFGVPFLLACYLQKVRIRQD